MKSGLMITGGELSLPFAREFLKKRTYDVVIAVDKGLDYAEQLGLKPDMAVGDFDTYGRERLFCRRMEGDMLMDIHQPEKDETDTELAFRAARSAGCRFLDILGATGGRLDHEISNIHLLIQGLRQGILAAIYDSQNRITVLDAGIENRKRFLKSQSYGNYISFLPLTEEVKGITLSGFKYPLYKKNLSVFENPSLCVSNELLEEEGSLTFDCGVLICVESRDRG